MFFRARPPRVATPAPARVAVLPVVLPDGRVVEVRRVDNARVRGLRLAVTERGIRVTAPPRASDRRVRAFVEEHAAWLAGQVHHTFGEVQPLRIGESATLPLRGVDAPVAWSEGRFLRVHAVDDGIAVTLPSRASDASVRKAICDFYLAEARADVGRWLPNHLPSLPRAPASILIRPLTSLWGSLAADGRLRLDLALVLAPPAAFEYVLVHELCHLIEANHSPAFWREVEQRFPDWKAQRDLLRTRGRPIKAALRAIRDAAALPIG
jgi:predicted metal-dependent hydrolase